MSQTAAMVQAKIVKGGGGGAPQEMDCAAILASFDPPIEFGPHSEMVGSMPGYQAEHIVPTSAAHQSGRSGPTMPGCDGYSTPDALTWMVGDGQSEGMEHKLLTDPMREFSQANDLANRQAPLSEWLDEYKEGAKDALKNGKPQRKTPDGLDRDSLIDAAAECITEAAEAAFAAMDPPVTPETPLRNPWPATNAQRAAAEAASAGNAGSGLVGF
jgi:hypothetical protein